ncbi:hypothetical protein BRC72_11720 [Halobacteriales archaeon QH_7_66_36]|nr:MAG: hypothetical protein BRC72_11720 [Halobacteriales archaeon QH_7_66_36]
MKRRNYIKSVGGIALTPALTLTDTDGGTDTDTAEEFDRVAISQTRISPEEFKRRTPRIIGHNLGLEVEFDESDFTQGKHIQAFYQKTHPVLRIKYFEASDGEQIWVNAGGIIYEPYSMVNAAEFIQFFHEQVDFEQVWMTRSSYNYQQYTIGDWSAVTQDDLSRDGESTVAVIDGERIDFDSRGERQKRVRDEIVKRIFP